MLREENNSRSAKYFIELYHSATLRGAIERAATKEIETLLFGELVDIPIDVERIARRKRIRVRESNRDLGCRLARLVPKRGGFLAELKPDSTEKRKRATLAHEIGHTLFYRDDGNRPRHQIGILDDTELRAEEEICERFAKALLMPAVRLCDVIFPIPAASPALVLNRLHNTSQKFMVTLPLLASRLSEIEVRCPPYLIVFFRYIKNCSTRIDPRLRVMTSYSFGDTKGFRMWNNRSVEGVNLESVNQLFAGWGSAAEKESGRYIWSADQGILRTSSEVPPQVVEQVNVSLFDLGAGKWKSESLPMTVSSCLYSRQNATDREAQVIAVLSPQIAAVARVNH